jgi:uncharacterized membrane protein
MSRTLKWILGILAVVVIVGLVAAAAFVWWNRAPMAATYRAFRPQVSGTPAPNAPNAPSGQTAPGMPYGFRQDRRGPYGDWGQRGPMMGGRGFSNFGRFMPFGMGFFFLGGLLHLILPLGVLVLVAILFYQLGKRAGASTSDAKSEPPQSPQPGRKVAKS